MKVNISLLCEEIANKNMNIADFSHEIGMDASTFYRKKETGGLAFTVGQMHKTGEVLELSTNKLIAIFLSDNSQ